MILSFYFLPIPYCLSHSQVFLRGSDSHCVAENVWEDTRWELLARRVWCVGWWKGVCCPHLSAPAQEASQLGTLERF